MESVEIFDNIRGEGLDIGHDGEYTLQSDNITRLNIYPGENIDVVYDGDIIPFEDKTFDILLIVARIIPFASTPGCEKKFLSSADKNALTTLLEIAL